MLDIIVKNGMLVDGTGSPWFRADIGVKGGFIASIGRLNDRASKTIPAENLIVSPGFIDVHTHSERITEMPQAENFLRQGVTTVVSGNCGDSPIPLKPHLDAVAEACPGVNYAVLAGHGAVREKVMGMAPGAPGKKELALMRGLVEKAMEDGAAGISTGLFYVPGAYAEIKELIQIAGAAAGGVYATHARSAGGKLFQAIREAAAIGMEAGVPVEISHLKVLHKRGRTGRQRAEETLRLIEQLRSQGADITYDIHPYPATFTTLSSVVIPAWAKEGGKLTVKLSDAAFRRSIRKIVENKISWVGGAAAITITNSGGTGHAPGATLAEIASSRRRSPANAAMDMVMAGEPEPRAVFHALRSEDVARFIAAENSIIASDGGIRDKRELVHPRYYGTFPRVIREYVRERKCLSLEEAVRKMTSFPARKFSISGRGILMAGMKADIAVFSADDFRDTATFENPASYPEGMKWVIVNGKVAWDGSKVSRKRSGQVLRRA